MSVQIKLPGTSFPTGAASGASDFDINVMRTPNIRHWIKASRAVLSNGVVSLDDAVSRALVQSYGTAPTIDAAIGGKQTLTFGSAGAGIVGQGMRSANQGLLTCNETEFSICAVVRATGTSGSNLLMGYILGATTGSGNRSPNVRFTLGGAFQRTPQVLDNALAARTFVITAEYQNLNRIVLITFNTTDGWHWYTDNWSTAARTDTGNKEALTDGRWQIGTVGSGGTSLNMCGSVADIIVSDYDLSRNTVARQRLMTTLGTEYGISST